MLNEEEYERRNEAAAQRMEKNAENTSLSEEQHEVLAELCSIRHKMHCHPNGFWISESCDYRIFFNYIDSEINELLRNAGLPAIKFPDATNCPSDADWDMELNQSDYSDDEWEDMMDDAHHEALNFAEKINTIIEDYLKKIDEKHGTNYAPTGALRF